ncbi:MAG: F0F1 ATP synthase subunit alpha [Planctomycetes bacterium]|nr:F0F1 ATP synthase subunit alpha [Planctomycetota bacterium]
MGINVSEIEAVLKKEIENLDAPIIAEDSGTVLEVGDGIARIYGLSNVMAGELLEFDNGETGMALNLEENSVGAVVLGDFLGISEGTEVKRTGRLVSVPVGPDMLGRVVDPLGRPLDGGGPIKAVGRRPVEFKAPGIALRQSVKEPLQTGLKAVDSMIPIGRGQRELIIGDRGTGKTAIAIDTIINQKGKDCICVYVAIGLKASTVASVVQRLKQEGAMEYSIVVNASANMPAPLQFIAPYAGCAMAEYFMYDEYRDTLCVYDDLSKHAVAYRQISLLLRRPPGREAYPGDVFYLHSRLLERSARMADHYVIANKSQSVADKGVNGKTYLPWEREEAQKTMEGMGDDSLGIVKYKNSGGSLTALPIIETQAGEVSAYIPTNVISITDGQIYLTPDLFFSGVRPAVDVGISVSRVGGNAQIKVMKQVAGKIKLSLAQFRELEAFAQLGTELDAISQRQLDRGYRIVEIFKQHQYSPCDVIDQVLAIYAVDRGFADQVKVDDIKKFENAWIEYAHKNAMNIVEELRDKKAMSKELEEKLTAVLNKFKETF